MFYIFIVFWMNLYILMELVLVRFIRRVIWRRRWWWSWILRILFIIIELWNFFLSFFIERCSIKMGCYWWKWILSIFGIRISRCSWWLVRVRVFLVCWKISNVLRVSLWFCLRELLFVGWLLWSRNMCMRVWRGVIFGCWGFLIIYFYMIFLIVDVVFFFSRLINYCNL